MNVLPWPAHPGPECPGLCLAPAGVQRLRACGLWPSSGVSRPLLLLLGLTAASDAGLGKLSPPSSQPGDRHCKSASA